jgi:hypothetical protein
VFPDAAAAYHLTIAVAAAAVGVGLFLWTMGTAGVPTWRALLFVLAIVAGAHFGGVSHIVRSAPAWDWSALFTLSYRHPDAIAGVAVTFILFRPLLLPGTSPWLVADCLAPSSAFALVLMRINCFLAGCCFGCPTHVSWSIRQPPGSPASTLHAGFGWIASDALPSLPVHPLELYFLALSLAAGVLALWLLRRKAYDGQVILAYLLVHEGGKFLLEFLRGAPRGAYNPTVSLVLALGAGATLAWRAVGRQRPHAAGTGDPFAENVVDGTVARPRA